MVDRSLQTSREVTGSRIAKKCKSRQDQEDEDMTPTALQVANFDVSSAANVVLYAINLVKSLAAGTPSTSPNPTPSAMFSFAHVISKTGRIKRIYFP